MRITSLPGSLEERFRSPSVSLIDPRPVSALTYEEWVGVLDRLCRDVYGMGQGHPLFAGVTPDDWRRWYDDPDRATTRMMEAVSVVAACALCDIRLPLIAARGDVWVQWVADTQRQRGQFPEWARAENRRLIVTNLFGDAGIPTVTEPETSEAVDRALKRPHRPMDFGQTEIDMPTGMTLPCEVTVMDRVDGRRFLLSRLHAEDDAGPMPEFQGEFEPLVLPADMEPIRVIQGRLVVSESAAPSPVLDAIARVTEALAQSPAAPIPCPTLTTAVVGELHNDRDVPAILGTEEITTAHPQPAPLGREGDRYVIADDPHNPQDGAKAAHLARVKAWYEAQQAKRKAPAK